MRRHRIDLAALALVTGVVVVVVVTGLINPEWMLIVTAASAAVAAAVAAFRLVRGDREDQGDAKEKKPNSRPPSRTSPVS